MAKFSDAEVQNALNGRRTVRVYPFPGNEKLKVGIIALTDVEQDGCRLRAAEYAKSKKAQLLLDPDFLDRAIMREFVFMAFRDSKATEDSFFAEADEVAQMDAVTVTACHALYVLHVETLDPFASCSREEVDELVQQLGKSESNVGHLKLFDADTLQRFVVSLAYRLLETQQTSS